MNVDALFDMLLMDATNLVFDVLEQDKRVLKGIKKRYSWLSLDEIKSHHTEGLLNSAGAWTMDIYYHCSSSAMYIACKLDQLETLKRLHIALAYYELVEISFIVAQADNPEIAKWIISMDNEPFTMYGASLCENAEHCLAYLEVEHPLDPSTLPQIQVEMFFEEAFEGGHLSMIKYLVGKGLTLPNSTQCLVNYEGWALEHADKGNDEPLQWLIDQGLVDSSELHKHKSYKI